MATLRELGQSIQQEEQVLRLGGGQSGTERQRKLGRLPVRERLALLLDGDRPFFELGLWAAHKMYPEWGAVPAAGVLTGIGWISQQPCIVAANDATVKAGAMFPQSVKKLIRAQKVAFRLRLPVVYLMDSAGVFLPLQDEIFPMKMILAESFAITLFSPLREFPNMRRSWAIVSQAVLTCRFSVTKSS